MWSRYLPRRVEELVDSGRVMGAAVGGRKVTQSLVVWSFYKHSGDSSVSPSLRGLPWCPGKIPWRRKQQPTPICLPGESRGQRSLAGYIHRVTKSQTRQSEHAHTSTAHPLVHNKCKSHSHRLVGRNEHLPCWLDCPDVGWWCGELFPCRLSGRGLTSAGFQRKEALPESWAFPPAFCGGKFCLSCSHGSWHVPWALPPPCHASYAKFPCATRQLLAIVSSSSMSGALRNTHFRVDQDQLGTYKPELASILQLSRYSVFFCSQICFPSSLSLQ